MTRRWLVTGVLLVLWTLASRTWMPTDPPMWLSILNGFAIAIATLLTLAVLMAVFGPFPRKRPPTDKDSR